MQKTMGELEPIKKIVRDIHKNRKKVGGGTGRRERYEMRKTVLYFRLGSSILETAKKLGFVGEAKQSFVANVGARLQEEFDDHENIYKWSVRFFEAFKEEQYFLQVSELCRDSFGQLREVIDILAVDNPLDIPLDEVAEFKKKFVSLETYDERRKLCTEVKAKFSGGGAEIDYVELRDSFDVVEKMVQTALNGNVTDREILRGSIGITLSQNLRFQLMLLSREETLSSDSSRGVIRKLVKSKPANTKIPEANNLYTNLKKFLVLNSAARNNLRKLISPYSMTLLQKMLLAIQSEDDYTDYQKTAELFRSISI